MPTLKLTARAIPKLKPGKQKKSKDGEIVTPRKVYRDTGVPGMYLEVHGSGVRTFGVWYRLGGDGKAGRYTLGRYQEDVFDLSDAHAAAREALHQARKGVDPAATKRQNREAGTFGDLVSTFLAWIKDHVRPATVAHWTTLLKHERLSGLRAMKPHDITRGDVIRLVEKIRDDSTKKKGKGYSANRTFEALRRCFTFAMSKDLVKHTPCVGIEKPTKEKARRRAYSDDELRSILTALDGSAMSNAIALCAYTGVRIAQALGAAWPEFKLPKTDAGAPDVANSEWLIPGERAGTKNGVDWLVPLTAPAVELLARLKADAEGPWVFPVRKRKDATAGRAWRQQRVIYEIRETSGVEDFRPHDLRRTLTTWLAAQKVTKEVRDAVLGHKPPQLEAVYNVHEYSKEKRQALTRWAKHLDRVMAEQSDKVVSIAEARA